MRGIVLAGLGLVALAPASFAATGGSYRDWALTCTPGLDCTASTSGAGEAASGGLTALSIQRGVGADDLPRLTIAQSEPKPPSGPVVLAIAGSEPVTLPASAFTSDDLGLSTPLETTSPLFQALRTGASVEIRVPSGGRAEIGRFSLSGLVAALRKMDEDQKRVETASALIDRGSKFLPDRSDLPADVVNAEALPDAVRKLWTDGPGSCSDLGDEPVSPLGFSLSTGPEARLYVLACGMPGAYNAPSRLYSATRDSADVVPVPIVAASGPQAVLDIWNVDWDGDRLTSFFKGRGIGDCGSYAEYRLEGAGLVLTQARDQPECNEQGSVDTWPQTWPLEKR